MEGGLIRQTCRGKVHVYVKLNGNFLGGRGVQNKKPSVGGVWIFFGITHFNAIILQCSHHLNNLYASKT